MDFFSDTSGVIDLADCDDFVETIANTWQPTNKPHCKWGGDCYRTSPEHIRSFSHPTYNTVHDIPTMAIPKPECSPPETNPIKVSRVSPEQETRHVFNTTPRAEQTTKNMRAARNTQRVYNKAHARPTHLLSKISQAEYCPAGLPSNPRPNHWYKVIDVGKVTSPNMAIIHDNHYIKPALIASTTIDTLESWLDNMKPFDSTESALRYNEVCRILDSPPKPGQTKKAKMRQDGNAQYQKTRPYASTKSTKYLCKQYPEVAKLFPDGFLRHVGICIGHLRCESCDKQSSSDFKKVFNASFALCMGCNLPPTHHNECTGEFQCTHLQSCYY